MLLPCKRRKRIMSEPESPIYTALFHQQYAMSKSPKSPCLHMARLYFYNSQGMHGLGKHPWSLRRWPKLPALRPAIIPLKYFV